MCSKEFWTPVLRAEIGDIDAARGDGENQMCDEIGAFQCSHCCDDAPDGLTDDGNGLIDFGQNDWDEIAYSTNIRAGWC